MKKYILYFCMILTLCTACFPSYVNATETKPLSQLHIDAKAAIAIDAKTGQILYEQNSNQPLPIASMTKLISMAVVLDAIHNKQITWNDKVTISSELSQLSHNTDLANIPLDANKAYTVKDLYTASLVYSANACVMALADKVAGSQEQFIQLMKHKLHNWGIKDAHIITTTGLNNAAITQWQLPNTKKDDENQLTAKDMAIVAQHIVNDYPSILNTTKLPTATFDQTQTITNWNLMLPSLSVYTPGVDGLKTGTTDKAGACFTGTAKRNGWRIITVVMNVTNGVTDKSARFVQTQRLMNAVYDTYTPVTLKAKDTLKKQSTIFIKNAKQQHQAITVASPFTYIKAKDIPIQWETKSKSLEAPVSAGTTAKILTFKSPYGYVSKSPILKLSLVHDVQKASWWTLLKRVIFD